MAGGGDTVTAVPGDSSSSSATDVNCAWKLQSLTARPGVTALCGEVQRDRGLSATGCWHKGHLSPTSRSPGFFACQVETQIII